MVAQLYPHIWEEIEGRVKKKKTQLKWCDGAVGEFKVAEDRDC